MKNRPKIDDSSAFSTIEVMPGAGPGIPLTMLQLSAHEAAADTFGFD
jgi:hypothetical protein